MKTLVSTVCFFVLVLSAWANADFDGVGFEPPVLSQTINETQVLSTDSGAISTSLVYSEAGFLKVRLQSVELKGDDALIVSDAYGNEVQRLTAVNNSSQAQWLFSVLGNQVSLSLNGQTPGTQVIIDRTERGFSEAEMAAREPREESICGSDDKQEIACFQRSNRRIFNKSKAVARLIFPCSTSGSGGLCTCTAWRVNPKNNTMMTNNHCISASAQIPASEVIFNYQNSSCNGNDANNNRVIVSVDEILVTDYTTDMTLFTINNPSSVESFGALTLDNRSPVAGENIYIPQHPGGRDKELGFISDQDGGKCVVNQAQVNGRGVGTDLSYYCDTEGGSSGSPVLASNPSHQVIGLHHFGGCTNQGVRVSAFYSLVEPYLQ